MNKNRRAMIEEIERQGCKVLASTSKDARVLLPTGREAKIRLTDKHQLSTRWMQNFRRDFSNRYGTKANKP